MELTSTDFLMVNLAGDKFKVKCKMQSQGQWRAQRQWKMKVMGKDKQGEEQRRKY